jgi:phage anti-repressor protein
MKELIKIEEKEMGGERIQAVNARDLHAFLENKDHFSQWIKQRIEQYGFVANQDFVTFSENTEKGRPRVEFKTRLNPQGSPTEYAVLNERQ